MEIEINGFTILSTGVVVKNGKSIKGHVRSDCRIIYNLDGSSRPLEKIIASHLFKTPYHLINRLSVSHINGNRQGAM